MLSVKFTLFYFFWRLLIKLTLHFWLMKMRNCVEGFGWLYWIMLVMCEVASTQWTLEKTELINIPFNIVSDQCSYGAALKFTRTLFNKDRVESDWVRPIWLWDQYKFPGLSTAKSSLVPVVSFIFFVRIYCEDRQTF